MSPDNDEQQQVTQLPEVPQIIQPEPATSPEPVAEVPTAPQPVEQPAVSVPDVTAPVIVSPAPVVPPASGSIDGFTQPAQPVMSPANPPVRAFNDIAPVQPVSPAPTPAVAPVTPMFGTPTTGEVQPLQAMQPAKKKTNVVMLVSLIVGSLVVLGGIAAIVFLFVLPGLGKIAEADLVSATTNGTSYLHPKQWKEVSDGNTSGYGDKLAKDGKSTAEILTKKGSYVQADITSVSDDQLSAFRKTMVDAYSSSQATKTLQGSTNCSDIKNVTTTENTLKAAHSVGVFTITADCTADNVKFKMVYYAVLGDDGYARTVFLIANENGWKQNEAIFNKMLNSADQG